MNWELQKLLAKIVFEEGKKKYVMALGIYS